MEERKQPLLKEEFRAHPCRNCPERANHEQPWVSTYGNASAIAGPGMGHQSGKKWITIGRPRQGRQKMFGHPAPRVDETVSKLVEMADSQHEYPHPVSLSRGERELPNASETPPLPLGEGWGEGANEVCKAQSCHDVNLIPSFETVSETRGYLLVRLCEAQSDQEPTLLPKWRDLADYHAISD